MSADNFFYSSRKSSEDLSGQGLLFTKDSRDKDYPLLTGVVHADFSKSVRWKTPVTLNQMDLSCCVGCACAGFINAAPVTGNLNINDAWDIYIKAQQFDGLLGEEPNSHGTTLRAGLKVLQDRGLIESYLWTNDANEIWNHVVNVGPVIFGTRWYSKMANPTSRGVSRVTGKDLGGHAYVCVGTDGPRMQFLFQNSWGTRWGDRGFFWIPFTDVVGLLSVEGSSAVAPIQSI